MNTFHVPYYYVADYVYLCERADRYIRKNRSIAVVGAKKLIGPDMVSLNNKQL